MKILALAHLAEYSSPGFHRRMDGVTFPSAPDAPIELDESQITQKMIDDPWVRLTHTNGKPYEPGKEPAASKTVKAGGK